MNDTGAQGSDTGATTGGPAKGEFVAIEGKVKEDIPAVPFVGIAYGFIWIALVGYVLYVAGGLGKVRRQIADLQKKLDGK